VEQSQISFTGFSDIAQHADLKHNQRSGKMTIKVVYNARYGGFSISQECAQLMADRGCKEAQKMLDEFHDPEAPEGWEATWYGHWEGDRHDPLLVKAVESLGRRAGEIYINGGESQHGIRVLRGTKYIIKEYDGLESVVEPEDIDWIEVDE
jgi:hypothetical protein